MKSSNFQLKIAEKLQVSQLIISRLLGKKKRVALHELSKLATDKFLDAYRAKLFFDDLFIQINEIETDKPELKIKKINQYAKLIEKSLYLASQGIYMQFVQYTNELVEEHELENQNLQN